MYQTEFQHKLRRLNPRLYISGDARRINDEWAAQGLFLRRATGRTPLDASVRAHADGDTQKFLDEQAAGLTDDHVCSVPAHWVPEYPVFCPITRSILARGWRGIVLQLVENGHTTLSRARAVFSSSIGESDYDRMAAPLKQKMHLAEMKRDAQ